MSDIGSSVDESANPPGKPLSAGKVLADAAYLLETRGWTQHVFGRDKAGYEVAEYALSEAACLCAIGAIAVAVGRMPDVTWDGTVAEEATDLLAKHIGTRWIPGWNDEPGRTREEVIGAFRGAAAKAVEG